VKYHVCCMCVVCCAVDSIVAESCCETTGAIHCQVDCLYVWNIVEYRILLNVHVTNSGAADIRKQCHATYITPRT